jgi:hypothetical protein
VGEDLRQPARNNRLAARLASLVCPTYSAPPSHRLRCKRVRRQGLALRVTRRHCRGHDAEANPSFCHAHVVYVVGQERRATATGTLWDNAPFSLGSQSDSRVRSSKEVVSAIV